MGEKWSRGMDGVDGEAVIEEAGTWWRTLGPSSTSKMARKIALSMADVRDMQVLRTQQLESGYTTSL